MLNFRLWMEDNSNSFIIEKCYAALNGVKTDAGNCGQVAFAIIKYVFEKQNKYFNIGIITNAQEEKRLSEKSSIYHVYVVDNDGQRYDNFGKIDQNYLSKLAGQQYKDNNPKEFIFDLPEELAKIQQVIENNTNWERNWSYFYNILKQKLD